MPKIGLSDLVFLGPSKEKGQEPINRGIFWSEEVANEQHIRLFVTVPTAGIFKTKNTSTGEATGDYKDVQQDPNTGRILFCTGSNKMLWVSGGRPLRSLKWAEKYVGEHKEKHEAGLLDAQQAQDALGKLEALNKQWQGLQRSAFRTAKDFKNERNRLMHAKQVAKQALAKAREKAASSAWTLTLDNPIIRSFLLTVKDYEAATRNAIPESSKKTEDEESTFNVDRHYEPNQYGFQGAGLATLRSKAVPGSLVSYVRYPEKLTKTERATAGEVKAASELYEALGIPARHLDMPIWVHGTGFQKKDKFEGQAELLSMYYGTWVDSKQRFEDRRRSALLTPKKQSIPYFRRKELMDEFLRENNVKGTEQIERFMEEVVSPWASQAMIAHVMAEDFDRLRKDENIGDVPFDNAFGKWRDNAPARTLQLKKLGKWVDGQLKTDAKASSIIEHIIKEFPGLDGRYAKICATSEGYSFYVHAQMVLNQFRGLVQGESDKSRALPINLVAKAILFHDMEKVNSKLQYGKEGEHVLTVNEIKCWAGFFGDELAVKRVVALVDADPLGDYFKGKRSKDETFFAIVKICHTMGFAPKDYPRFFRELHQYYQSDFSSYTSAAWYYDRKRDEEYWGRGVMDRFFVVDDHELALAKDPRYRRFKYSSHDDYEKKFVELASMFATQSSSRQHAERLERREREAESQWRNERLR